MAIKYAALTRKGVGRSENQDRVVVAGTMLDDGYAEGDAEDCLLAVVCDGMGEADSGAKAATIVGGSFRGLLDNANPPLSIFRQIELAENDLSEESRNDPRCSQMATTIAGVYLDDEECIVFNAGDTRVYELADDGPRILTDDHTRAQAMVDALFAHSADELPVKTRSTLLRYLGGGGGCKPAFSIRPPSGKAIRLAICSDGAYRVLGERGLGDAVRGVEDLRSCCDAVYTKALASGSNDDVSVVFLERAV